MSLTGTIKKTKMLYFVEERMLELMGIWYVHSI